MNVAFFLTPKSEVAFVSVGATLDEALVTMQRSGHPTLPVLRGDGSYLGTVSEATLLVALLHAEIDHQPVPHEEPLAALPVDHACPVLGVGASIESVLLRVVDHSFLPVVDDRGAFIGIVRRRDVVSHFAHFLLASAIAFEPRVRSGASLLRH
jgi:CBS domain-containing protein